MPKPLDQPTRVSTKKVAKLRKDPRVLKNSVPEEGMYLCSLLRSLIRMLGSSNIRSSTGFLQVMGTGRVRE